jgi:hypothetical protein
VRGGPYAFKHGQRNHFGMSRRSRILSFGSCAVLVLVGAICGAVIGGTVGQLLALGFIAVGLIWALSLVFLEVGLSEDRDRAREQRERARQEREQARTERERMHEERKREHTGDQTSDSDRPRPRLDRMRGRPRRLK